LQEQSEDHKEEEEENEIKIDSTFMNEDEEISTEELKREKLELKVQKTLKDIGVRLFKIQENHRVHYHQKFESILEDLGNRSIEQYFRKLKDTLEDMKAQAYVTKVAPFFFKKKLIPEEFEIERAFLGLCGFEVKEVVGNDEDTKEEEKKKTFEICGSTDIET
ncbi:hypothetical protein RFI_38155, partial [Reticulomyxa filosa]